jgi:ribosome maturation factor RimP
MVENQITQDDSASARLVQEEGLDAVVASVVAPVIEDLGFRLVRARMIDHNGLTMQIMAERPDGTMSVADCELISKALSPVLDVEDPVAQAYNLELSSPGIDRPLVRRSDFETWAGHVAKIETAYLLDGRKRFRGHIVNVSGDGGGGDGSERDGVLIRRDNAAKGEEKEVTIPFEAISAANLVLTDELIREALVRDKALRKANDMDADEDGIEE